MPLNKLFAVDAKKGEVIVSESPRGSRKIMEVERVVSADNPTLYQAVILLGSLSKDPELDMALFKAMDKVCQLLYEKHKGRRVKSE